MKANLLIIFFLAVMAAIPVKALCAEKDQSVTVMGEAVIYEGNTPQAKERALQEAFSTAITKVMGAYITAESFTQNYVSIDRSVLSKTRGYVKEYKILELREQPEILSVTVLVMVSGESVKDDLTALGILLDAVGNPVVEIRGEDQGLEHSESIPALKRIFSAKGFYVVDENAETPPDVIVKTEGRITNRNVVGNTGFHGVVAKLDAKAIRRSTQEVIAAESAVSNGAGLNEDAALKQAYQQAAEVLASKLIGSVSEKWSRELTSGKTISLSAKTGSYDTVQQFTKHLSRLFGVKKVDLKSFNSGEARYLVRFAGQSKTLADLILRTPPQDLSISIKGFDTDSLALRVN